MYLVLSHALGVELWVNPVNPCHHRAYILAWEDSKQIWSMSRADNSFGRKQSRRGQGGYRGDTGMGFYMGWSGEASPERCLSRPEASKAPSLLDVWGNAMPAEERAHAEAPKGAASSHGLFQDGSRRVEWTGGAEGEAAGLRAGRT